MARKLRKKQKEFVKQYVANDENGTQAVIDSGYNVKSRDVAKVVAYENLTKPHVAEAIEVQRKTIAEQIPDELLVEKHTALLNKTEKRLKNNVTTGEIEVIETGEIDGQAVAKGLDLAYKLKGSFAPDKIDLSTEIKTSTENIRLVAKQISEELKKIKT